jgi:WD40 repeat protein
LFRPEIGLLLASAGDADDSRVTLFDSENGRHEDVTWWIAESKLDAFHTSDGHYYVLAMRYDRGVKTIWWDRRAGKTVAEFAGVVPLAVAPDGRWVTAGNAPQDLALRAPVALDEILRVRRGSDWSEVAFSPDGRYLLLRGQQTEILDAATVQVRVRLSAPQPIVLSDIGQVVALEYMDGDIALSRWDLETGALLGKQIVAVCTIEQVMEQPFSFPDHGRFVVRHSDSRPESILEESIGRIPLFESFFNDRSAINVIFDARTGGEVMRIQPRGNAAVQLSPDGRTLAVFASDNRVQLWDIPPRKSLTWFAAGAALLAFSIALVARRRIRRLKAA